MAALESETHHQGQYRYSENPMQTFLDTLSLVREKRLNRNVIGQSNQP